jgi:hypothetical protein
MSVFSPASIAAISTIAARSTISARRWSRRRLFSTVSAEPVLTEETAEDGTRYVNVLVRQDAGPARTLDATAGYSTGEGFRIEAAWEHRNLLPPEGRAAHRRHRRHSPSRTSLGPLPPQQWGAARPRFAAPARHTAPAISRRSKATRLGSTG